MKSATAATTPVRPLFIAKKTSDYHRGKLKKVAANGRGLTPPSEETLNRLNGIGREYPFCVYYKEKRYDPL